ncbi:hypothetical protein CEP52_012728 [Fusarium oligoseptatum]|uniref:Uncharacterized protein n=1 Tax=Fusarium oligoseptatum TaxID=2604345 RepID=A0A428SWY1_9HYPO|nr:hypothetical protein CEP52_012728 [Fusarium oligoseptatum]
MAQRGGEGPGPGVATAEAPVVRDVSDWEIFSDDSSDSDTSENTVDCLQPTVPAAQARPATAGAGADPLDPGRKGEVRPGTGNDERRPTWWRRFTKEHIGQKLEPKPEPKTRRGETS